MLSDIFIISCLAKAVASTMVLSMPVPYHESGNGFPLFSNGSNFPCSHSGSSYTFDSSSNVYYQGSHQKLVLTGNLGNNGGSCQVSITTDLQPSQSTDWRVIKSIIGGCPFKAHNGTLPGDADAANQYTFDFEIPAGIAAGKYSFAWTWFNGLGNPAMYMNCAPITVLGSGGSPDFINTLPRMFIANINTNGCSIPKGTSVVFPDPGLDVDRIKVGGATFANGIRCASASRFEKINGPPAPASQRHPAVQLVPMSTIPDAPAPANSSIAIQPPPPRNSTSDVTSSTAFDTGMTCADEGYWNCIEGTAFQRCGGGVWSAVTEMPSGVECVAGRTPELEFAEARGGEITLRHAVRGAPA